MATKKYAVDLDINGIINLNKKEIRNAVIHNLTTAPSTPAQGQVYYNTTSSIFYIYDGANWDELRTTGVTSISAGTGISATTGDGGNTYTVTNTDLGSSQNIFKNMSDGTVTAAADSNNDTFKFRSANGVSVTVGSDDATHGDNLLIGLSQGGVAVDRLASSAITINTANGIVGGTVGLGNALSLNLSGVNPNVLTSSAITVVTNNGLTGAGTIGLGNTLTLGLSNVNPSVLSSSAVTINTSNGLTGGGIVGLGNALNLALTSSNVTINTANGIVGGTVPLGGSVSLSLSNVNPSVLSSSTITLTAGTGISITNSGVVGLGGNITISSTGGGGGGSINEVTGTANQITATNTSGSVALSLPNQVTFPGSVTVTGDLTVQGDTVTLNVATLNVEDNEIILNSGVTGAPALDGLLTVNRGTSNNVSIKWNETSDKWTYTNDGTTYSNIGNTSKYAANIAVSSSAGLSASTFAVTHNLGTQDVIVQVYEVATDELVDVYVKKFSASVAHVGINGLTADNQYRAIVIG